MGIKQEMGNISRYRREFSSRQWGNIRVSENNFYRYSNAQLTQTGTYTIVEDTMSFTVHGKRITFNGSGSINSEKFVMITDTANF